MKTLLLFASFLLVGAAYAAPLAGHNQPFRTIRAEGHEGGGSIKGVVYAGREGGGGIRPTNVSNSSAR